MTEEEVRITSLIDDINEYRKLFDEQALRRLPGAILTNNTGKCEICGIVTGSGMMHICDGCFDAYSPYFLSPKEEK